MKRACTVCGGIADVGNRCRAHQRRGRGGAARAKAAREVVAAADVCWRCGEPARPDDPLTADHAVVPHSAGGPFAAWNMRAAHRSCNSRAGRQQQEGLPTIY